MAITSRLATLLAAPLTDATKNEKQMIWLLKKACWTALNGANNTIKVANSSALLLQPFGLFIILCSFLYLWDEWKREGKRKKEKKSQPTYNSIKFHPSRVKRANVKSDFFTELIFMNKINVI